MLTALGWIAALLLLAASVSSARHGFREKARGPWVAAGMYVCAAVILLAVDGVLKPLTAGVLAFLALAAAAGLALAKGRDGAGKAALGHAGAGIGYLGADARGIWQRITAGSGGRGPDGGSGEAAEAAVEAVGGTRVIPPVRDDPSLGVPPEPAVIASVPVPPAYAELAAYISGFEPGDDQDLRMFMEGSASGGMVVAEAWRAFADTCLSGAGLHPAYVAGILEVGDTEGEAAGHKAQVHKRFGVIYGSVKEWIAGHGPLPHKAREFLTGDM